MDLTVDIKLEEPNKLCVSANTPTENLKYIFKFYHNGEYIDKSYAQESLDYVYWLTDKGTYQVEVAAVDPNENISRFWSDKVEFQGLEIHENNQQKKENIFGSVYSVLSEIWENRRRWWRIGVYDYKIRDKDAYLGKLWRILNPLIQIFTYWLIFGIGLRQNQMIGDQPYLVWMLTGLLPWFFLNGGIIGGANSVFTKAGTVLKLKYPVSTIPISSIVTDFFDFAITLVILFILMIFYKDYPNLYWLNLLYYIGYTIFFLCALAFITSTLTMIARDFLKFLQSIMRLLFYLTPILWSIESLPQVFQNILEINPLYYIIRGFRDSLLYDIPFWAYPQKILFFWILNIALLIIGCRMQRKFQNYFIDFL